MMDFRPVLYVLGIMLVTLAFSMALPMIIDLYSEDSDWRVFFISMLITFFFGGSLAISNRSRRGFSMTLKQAFLLTVICWVFISLFAAIPFWISDLQMSFTDSYFEAMSGITTTGSTVMTGLDQMPNGILIWRSILQWLGGIGIIVMALSVLPFLNVGGMQLFKMESSEREKALPRATQLASSISMIYIALTLFCMAAYMAAGLTPFDSISHAMTTISTGGFSTSDSSFFSYNTIWPEIVAIIFMLLGGMPFVLFLKAIQGNSKSLFKDKQVRVYLLIILFLTVILSAWLVLHQDFTIGEAVRRVLFSVISIITTTGYCNADYSIWGGFAALTLFFLTFVGACSGSTGCGIKVFRFQVLYAVTKAQIKQLLYPNGSFIPHYNGKPIPKNIPVSVMGFFFVYILSFVVLAILLAFTGLDLITALSGAATVISNVGPGLGETIGPTGTYQTLSDTAKWILTAAMLLGRLELFTVLVLFSPHFWRR